MRNGEKKRKRFHEALLTLYHPSPPSPPPPTQTPPPKSKSPDPIPDFDSDDGSAEKRRESTQSDASDDGEPQKLSRAQRKRIRKRKLKEAASSRREIVGPLLPPGYQTRTLEYEAHQVFDEKPENTVQQQKPKFPG